MLFCRDLEDFRASKKLLGWEKHAKVHVAEILVQLMWMANKGEGSVVSHSAV